MCAHIFRRVNLLQIAHHIHQLSVVFLAHKGLDRDPIAHLKCERNDRVVYNNNVFHLSVCYHSEVLYVHASRSLHAVLPVQSVFDNRSVFVNKVQDLISIVLLTCSENDNLI